MTSLLDEIVSSEGMRKLIVLVAQGLSPDDKALKLMIKEDPSMVLDLCDTRYGVYVHWVWSGSRQCWIRYVGVGAGDGGTACIGSIDQDQVRLFAGQDSLEKVRPTFLFFPFCLLLSS